MTDSSNPNVGQNIRNIRLQQGYSLRSLSERSGLSTNAISLIERGANSPTVSSLHLLANGLGVSITDFFQTGSQQSVVLVRAAERLRSESNGVAIENLAIGLANQQLEPFMVTAEPKSGTWGQSISHPGEEFVYCLAGKVEYQVGTQTYHLATGDSLLFDATLEHCFRATDRIPAQILMVFLAGAGAHLAQRVHDAEVMRPLK